jgi:para-nitrobenzyl esterase
MSSAQAPAKAAGSDPIVSISTGQLRGSLTSDGGAVFKNIPFAQPPVGDLRWREPQPAKAWTGVRDATTMGPMCHQNDNLQLPHSEDCLQLNVWTPKSPMTSPVPVMVWVHGGGNTAGSGIEALFNGEVLASHGAVVVNVNYRLGVFGFFAHPGLTKESPHHASGNYGLADQIMALRWVQDNIAKPVIGSQHENAVHVLCGQLPDADQRRFDRAKKTIERAAYDPPATVAILQPIHCAGDFVPPHYLAVPSG